MTFLHTCGCVSARPLISQVYFRPALVPTVPRTVSLCLHPTNCALSLNTLSAFNYCLRALGSGGAHSVGSLRGSASVACVRVQLVRFNVQNVLYRQRRIEGSAEFHRTTLPPPTHHIMHCWPATSWTVFGVQMARKGASVRACAMRRDCDYLITFLS